MQAQVQRRRPTTSWLHPTNWSAQKYGEKMIPQSVAGGLCKLRRKGATQSSTIVYEIEPGGRLGWLPIRRKRRSTSSRERNALCGRQSSYPVGPGSVFVLPTGSHDLETRARRPCGRSPSCAAMFTAGFDNVMLPPKSHTLGRRIGKANGSSVGWVKQGG